MVPGQRPAGSLCQQDRVAALATIAVGVCVDFIQAQITGPENGISPLITMVDIEDSANITACLVEHILGDFEGVEVVIAIARAIDSHMWIDGRLLNIRIAVVVPLGSFQVLGTEHRVMDSDFLNYRDTEVTGKAYRAVGGLVVGGIARGIAVAEHYRVRRFGNQSRTTTLQD